MATISGHGTIVKITINSTLTTIPDIEELEMPKTKDDIEDVKLYGQRYPRKVVIGTSEVENAKIKLLWDGANTVHQAVLSAAAFPKAAVNMEIHLADGRKFAMSTFVTDMMPDAPADKAVRREFELVPAAGITETPPA